jgi:hypothetical protein
VSRFVIIGGGRTGSSHLVRVLNQHPEILCHGESFHGRHTVHVRLSQVERGTPREEIKQELLALRNQDPFAYLEKIYSLGGEKPVVGFKIFERHNVDILKYVIETSSIQKVVLVRTNGLARYASLMTAHETGEWASAGTRSPARFIEEAFLEQYNEYMAFIADQLQKLVSLEQPFRILRYDELNNDTVMNALVDFLGAKEPMPPAQVGESHRGAPNIISRFSNPADVEAFLHARGLMHWAYEGDTSFAPLSVPQS